MAVTMSAHGQCTGGTLTLDLIIDNYGSETTWEVRNLDTATVLFSGGPYAGGANGTVVENGTTFAVPCDACIGFELFDSFGDGICCDWGTGSYSLTYEDSGTGGPIPVVTGGGIFGFSEFTVIDLGTDVVPGSCDVFDPCLANPAPNDICVAEVPVVLGDGGSLVRTGLNECATLDNAALGAPATWAAFTLDNSSQCFTVDIDYTGSTLLDDPTKPFGNAFLNFSGPTCALEVTHPFTSFGSSADGNPQILHENVLPGTWYYPIFADATTDVDGDRIAIGNYVVTISVTAGEPCPTGACCAGDGSCTVTTEADCLLVVNSEWFEGEDCATFDCPVGSCCDLFDELQDPIVDVVNSCIADGINAPQCFAQGGELWIPDTVCADNPCPIDQKTNETCLTSTVVDDAQIPYAEFCDNIFSTADDTDLCEQAINANTQPMQNDLWWSIPVATGSFPPGPLNFTVTVINQTPGIYDFVGGIYSGLDCNTLAVAEFPAPGDFLCEDDPEPVHVFTFQADSGAGLDYWVHVGDFGTIAGGGAFDIEIEYSAGDVACCFPDGSCLELSLSDCEVQGGEFSGSSCDPNECPQPATDQCALLDDVIYSNGGPVGESGTPSPSGSLGLSSEFDGVGGIESWVADDWTPAQDENVTDLHFYSIETGGFIWNGDVEYAIWTDAAGLPDDPAGLVATGIVAASRIDTGDTVAGFPLWFYTLDGLDIDLTGGTLYWIGLRPHSDTTGGQSFNAVAVTGVTGSPAAQFFSGAWALEDADIAFCVTSVEEVACPGDLSGDGLVVDFQDLLALFGFWGPCPAPPALCPGDLSGDGLVVDFQDLLALFGFWGPCPP